MPEYLAPGVYVEEVRGDVVPIQGVSTSTAGFVGLTERGPTQPLLVTSWPEFQRWYGDLLDPAVSALPLSVQGFFANGGQRVFIARVTGANAEPGSLDLAANGNAPTVTARGAGTWSGRVSVRVLAATKDPVNRFRLQVAYYRGATPSGGADPRTATAFEDYDELSVDGKDARYAPGVVNAASHLVSIEWGPGTPGIPTPGAFQPLAGGTDGDAVDAATFIGDPAVPPDELTGLAGLAAIDEIAILAVPDAVNKQLLSDVDQRDSVKNAIIDQCESLRDRVAVLDVEPGSGDVTTIAQQNLTRRSDYAAIYYPHVRVFDPRSRLTALVPPSGFVAGLYAYNDVTRGVHKAPANYELRGILTRDLTPTEGPLEYVVTKGQQDILNPLGVNVIRDFRASGRGIRVWGARTISSDPEWIYVNVRRLFNFVEESVDEGLQWVVFEPNAEPTWARVRRTIETFLERVWRDGALMGTTREEAFFVRCDRTTMTTDDILNGRLICLVGMAAVRPAEFVILRFSQLTVEASS